MSYCPPGAASGERLCRVVGMSSLTVGCMCTAREIVASNLLDGDTR